MVGIRDPRGPRDAMFAVAPIEDHSFSTSGDYERGFVKDGVRYHHILDPRTGQPGARVALGDDPREGRVHRGCVEQGDVHLRLEEGPRADQARTSSTDFEVVWVDDKNEVHMTPGIEKDLQDRQAADAGAVGLGTVSTSTCAPAASQRAIAASIDAGVTAR